MPARNVYSIVSRVMNDKRVKDLNRPRVLKPLPGSSGSSVKYRRDTKVFEANVQNGNYYQLTLPDVIASRGGLPLVVGGKLVGAIGCSGGTGSQDEIVAKAGVAALEK
jgi:uncharacterized protein GlcG (DUF336 family)